MNKPVFKYYIFIVKPYLNKYLFKNNLVPRASVNTFFNLRVRLLMNQYHRCGNLLKVKLMFLNLCQLITFRLKTKNPLFLVSFVLQMLEPFFELKTIRRRRRVVQAIVVNSLKRRVVLAAGFLFDGVYSVKKKKPELVLLFNEVCLILTNPSKSFAVQKAKEHNKLINKSRFLLDKQAVYVGKFPKKFI